jgi:hypothetical protein
MISVLQLQIHMSLMAQSPRSRNIGDRFIPTRAGNNWQIKFAMSTVSILNNPCFVLVNWLNKNCGFVMNKISCAFCWGVNNRVTVKFLA